jgi:hypothetical protein
MSSTISKTTVSVAPTPTLGKYNINIKGSYDAEIKERVSQLFQNNLPLILALAVLTIPVFFAAWPIGYMLVRQDKELELNSQIAERKLMFLRELGYMLPQDLTDKESINIAFSEMAKDPDARLLFQEHDTANIISDNAKDEIIGQAHEIKNNEISEKETLIKLRLNTIEETEKNTDHKKIEKNGLSKLVKSFNKSENLKKLEESIIDQITLTIKDGKQLYDINNIEKLLQEFSRTVYHVKAGPNEVITVFEAKRIRECINELTFENQRTLSEIGKIKFENGVLKKEEDLSEEDTDAIRIYEEKIKKNEEIITREFHSYTGEVLKFINTLDPKNELEFENKKLLHKLVVSSLMQTIPNTIMSGVANSLIELQGNELKYGPAGSESDGVQFDYKKSNHVLKITYGDSEGIDLTIKNSNGKIIPNLKIRLNFEITVSLQKNIGIPSGIPIPLPDPIPPKNSIPTQEEALNDAKRRAAAKAKPMYLSFKLHGLSVVESS